LDNQPVKHSTIQQMGQFWDSAKKKWQKLATISDKLNPLSAQNIYRHELPIVVTY
jgi:hypothetical protein